MVRSEDLKITCADGIELSGTCYHPEKLRAAVMLAPATGIRRRFYHAFSNFLAEQGFAVLTFDHRGIGQSRGKNINGTNASLVNWGKLDMSAVLEALKNRFPKTDYHLVGHSAGGQLVGLMKNAHQLKSMFNVGSSSGSIKHARYPFKLKSFFWVNIYIPLSNLLFGHTKAQWVGMGEPLPKAVSAQWRKWCNGEGYVEMELGKTIHKHAYDTLRLPSLWVHATDDEIANPESTRDMVRVYTKIKAEILALDPNQHGYEKIGHMKFFSSKKKKLWQYALDWLNKNHTS